MLKKYKLGGNKMTSCRNELGKFIRERRLELGLSQEKLAHLVGLTQLNVSAYEIGKVKSLSGERLELFAKALQCDLHEFQKRIPTKNGSEAKTKIGKIIRSRRLELGWTIEEFAKKMGVSHSTVYKIENRGRGKIQGKTLNKLTKVLKLDPLILAPFVLGKTPKNELGRLIRAGRKELGMSVSQLASKMNVSPQFVYKVEMGINSLCANNKMIQKFAEVLELDLAKLLSIRETRKRKKIDGNDLGNFFAGKRLEQGLTQTELGKRINCSASAISEIEREGKKLCRNALLAIVDYFKCEIPPELKKIFLAKTRLPLNISEESFTDLLEAGKLNGHETNEETIEKALKIYRTLLEKKNEGFGFCLKKNNEEAVEFLL